MGRMKMKGSSNEEKEDECDDVVRQGKGWEGGGRRV